MVQKLRLHQQSVIYAYNVNCYCLLPLLQLHSVGASKLTFSDISDVDDDITDDEGGTAADTTK